MTTFVRAAIFDGRQMQYGSKFPEPEPGESLVRVTLAGICGTDLEILHGYMGYRGILGHEFVGVVETSENPDLIGRRVVGEINVACGQCDSCARGMERHCPRRTVLGILNRNGAFAEYLSLPAKNLHAVPDTVSDEQAVFVEPLAAAFEIKEQVRIRPDWRIAVVGDGRLAQLVAMVLGMSSSSDVTCFGHHPGKLRRLERLGMHAKTGIGIPDEHGFDLVVEATGSPSGFGDAVRIVKPRGTMVLKSTIASRKDLDLTPAVVNEVTMVGSRCGPFRPAIKALSNKAIPVSDLVDSVYPLAEIRQALERAQAPGVMKVLLRP